MSCSKITHLNLHDLVVYHPSVFSFSLFVCLFVCLPNFYLQHDSINLSIVFQLIKADLILKKAQALDQKKKKRLNDCSWLVSG